MRCPVQDQSIQHVIEAGHKTEQSNEHGNAESYTDSSHQCLAPTGKQQ